ncbi:MAG: mersacidin/lichenicidin family type 2 lantibiotic [Acidobacteriota bacterium]
MKKSEIVRAWRDPKYRRSLSAEQLSQLDGHPAGAALVEDDDLKSITGGCGGSGHTGLCTGCGNIHCY